MLLFGLLLCVCFGGSGEVLWLKRGEDQCCAFMTPSSFVLLSSTAFFQHYLALLCHSMLNVPQLPPTTNNP